MYLECIHEQGVSGRNKGEFYRARGWWNERISVFLYKRIDYTKLVAKREEFPSFPNIFLISIRRNFTSREEVKFRLRNRSVLPRIVRVIARMEEGARKAGKL